MSSRTPTWSRWEVTALLVGVVAVIGSVPAVGPVAPSVWVAVLLAAVVLFRYPVACLMVPILVAPVALREVPGTPGLQVIHLAVLVAIGGVFVGTMTGRLVMDPPPSLIWGGLFIAVVLTSTMVSVDSLTSLKVAINQVLGFVLAVCAALVARQSHDSLHWVLRGWTASALVVLLPALPAASSASDRFGGSLVEGRVQGAFAQPNDFAEFSLMGLAVAWALVAGSSRVADRILGATGILVALAGVAVSFSRGAWIAAAALVVIAFILAPRLLASVAVVGTSLVAFSAGALAAGIAPFPALLIRLQALLEGARNPEDDRLLIWRQGLRLFAENPIFGRGPGTFATGSYDLGSTLIQRPYIHSHNVPLTVAAEMGVLALVCLIGLTIAVGISCLSALRRLKLTGRNRETAELAVLGAGLVAIAVHGLVDVVYTNPFLIPLAWLLLGIVAGTCRRVLMEPQSAGDMAHPARDHSPALHR